MHTHTDTHTHLLDISRPSLTERGNTFSCSTPLPSSTRMQLGLKWNVKVALKRCLPHVNPTHHTYCSHRARLIILSLSSTRRRKREFERWGRGVGGETEREKWRRKKQQREKEKEKRVEEALNQETERSRHKDEKQSSGAPRVWGLCVGIMSGAKHIQPH